MFFWRNPVGIQSGPSRDPVGTQSGTNFSIFGHRFWPVGIQSGSSRAPIFEFFAPRLDLSGSSQITQKRAKTLQKCCFLCIWLPPDIGARLDPDWIPTGSRLAKSGAQKCKNWCPTGSRRDPDEIPTGSIDRQEPTPAPIFPFPDPPLPLFSFSAHQPCTNTPPSCTKTAKAVLSQTGVLQVKID